MKILMITRYGGAGDLLMLEPALEALYYRHRPDRLILRTYQDYRWVLARHPLISDIWLDSNQNRYRIDPALHGQSRQVPKSVRQAYPQASSFLHFNLQGAVEGSELHGVDAFAYRCNVTPLRRTPRVAGSRYRETERGRISVQVRNRQEGPERNLRQQDIAPFLQPYTVHYLEEGMDPQQFVDHIARSEIFIGPDSVGVHLAAALGVPGIIGFYTDQFPSERRAYPGVWSGHPERMYEIPRVVKALLDNPVAKPSVENLYPVALQWCRGDGLDVSRHGTSLPGAICTTPGWIGSGPFSFVFWSETNPGEIIPATDPLKRVGDVSHALRRGGYFFAHIQSPVDLTWWVQQVSTFTSLGLVPIQYCVPPGTKSGGWAVFRKKF